MITTYPKIITITNYLYQPIDSGFHLLSFFIIIHTLTTILVYKIKDYCIYTVGKKLEKREYLNAEERAHKAFKYFKNDESVTITYGRAILCRMCDDIQNKLKDFNILAIGDIMLDRVLQGHRVNSPRVAIHQLVSKTYMLTNKTSETNSLGGIGYLSRALRELGAKVTMIAVVGNDDEGKILKEICNGTRDISGQLIKLPKPAETKEIDFKPIPSKPIEDIITTNKIYFIYPDPNNPSGKKAIRFDREDVKLIEEHQEDIKKDFFDKFDDIMKKSEINCIVIDDYEKGLLTKDLMKHIENAASDNNIGIYVDPKNNWKKFKDCKIKAILPNRHECNSVLNTEKPTEDKLDLYSNIDEFVIKKDCDGAYFYNKKINKFYEVKPFGENKEAIDIGCGVVFDAYYTASRLCCNSIEKSTFLANYAAGLKTLDPKIGEIVSLETVKKNLTNEQDYFTKNMPLIKDISKFTVENATLSAFESCK